MYRERCKPSIDAPAIPAISFGFDGAPCAANSNANPMPTTWWSPRAGRSQFLSAADCNAVSCTGRALLTPDAALLTPTPATQQRADSFLGPYTLWPQRHQVRAELRKT